MVRVPETLVSILGGLVLLGLRKLDVAPISASVSLFVAPDDADGVEGKGASELLPLWAAAELLLPPFTAYTSR